MVRGADALPAGGRPHSIPRHGKRDGDSKLMGHVRHRHQGTFLVEGKVNYTFTLADGRHVTGHDFVEGEWPWRMHPWEPGVCYVRLQAQSSTYGAVTVVIVDEHGKDRYYLLCLETTLSGPVLIRRWRRRHWIEFIFRVLKHLLATESCQVHSEDAYYGHLVLRVMRSEERRVGKECRSRWSPYH